MAAPDLAPRRHPLHVCRSDMNKLSIRQIVPLAGLTAIGMLATDLYLPALPYLADELQTTLPTVQGTISVFIIALALSQLVWSAIADKLGMRTTLLAGVTLEIVASIACALATDVTMLILFRAVQGIGGGAATVVVPVLLRRRCAEADAVRALSLVGMAEAVIPAVGPLLGTVIVLVSDWRVCFWIIAALAVIAVPFIARNVDDNGPLHDPDAPVGYAVLLRHPGFLRHAACYALGFGALVAFVASAPHVMHTWLQQSPAMFAMMQVFGVACFMLTASRGGAAVQRHGANRMIGIGSGMQLTSTLLMLVTGLVGPAHASPVVLVVAIIVAWSLYCGGFGVAGPAAMTRALSVPPALTSLASGFLMFLALALAGAAIQAAGFLLRYGLWPAALLFSAMTAGSFLLRATNIKHTTR